jgi:hypothetical protein
VSDGGRMDRRGGLQTPSKGKGPPARQRRTSRPTTCRVHLTWAASARSVKCNERSTQPTSTIWCEPCQTAAGWKERRLPRVYRIERPQEGVESEKCNKRSTRPTSTTWCEPCRRRPDGRKTPRVYRIRWPLGGEQKVNATDKYYPA